MTFEISKIMLFTHNDLDGRGCEIVGKLAFGKDLETTVVRNPQHASEVITEFIQDGEYIKYSKIYITDISVDKDTAELIHSLDKNEQDKFLLLDHHGTALYLNKYHWAHVEVSGNRYGVEGKNAGTTMFFDYLMDNGFFQGHRYFHALRAFVEKIRRYDCWEWKDLYNDKEAGELNQLFYLIGSDTFVGRYIDKFIKGDLFVVIGDRWRQMFDDADRSVIEIDNKKKEDYINYKEKQMTRMSILGYNVGVVFSEQYISELGNALSERNQDLDFIAMIDMGSKKVSYRTVHDNVDLGKGVAKVFGGGGHSKASGSQFEEAVIVASLKKIFQEPKKSIFRKLIDFIK